MQGSPDPTVHAFAAASVRGAQILAESDVCTARGF